MRCMKYLFQKRVAIWFRSADRMYFPPRDYHIATPLNTVQLPSINYSASDVAVIPQFNSGTFGFHRNRSFPLPRFFFFLSPWNPRDSPRSFRRAVPRDRPAKPETRSSLGSPLYKYHTLLSASRLVAREHRGERGGEESRLRGPLRSVPRSRGPHRPSPVLSVAPATLWTKFIFSIIPTPSFDETSIDRVSFTIFFFCLSSVISGFYSSS